MTFDPLGPSRRQLLAAIGAGSSFTLAGCAAPSSADEPADDNSTETPACDTLTTDERHATIEREILSGANQYRVRREELAPVEWDDDLAAVAADHNADMIEREYFAHTDPDGNGPGDRVTAAGLTCDGLVEVLARRPQEPNQPPEAIAAKLVGQWIYSDPHYEGMTSNYVTHAGVDATTTDASHGSWPNSILATMVMSGGCVADTESSE